MRKATKTALCVSIALLIVWSLLGAGASLAWFTDTINDVRNQFLIGVADIRVSYYSLVPNPTYDFRELLPTTTDLFDDQALYEPGYTKVVYLKIENNGIPVDFRVSVTANSWVDGRNALGNAIHLPSYLKFGVLVDDNLTDLAAAVNAVGGRADARNIAALDMDDYENLNHYNSNSAFLDSGETKYAAIVVYMPEEVGNVANYTEDNQPSVNLGVTVLAAQKGTIDQL
ncbi:MAG: hypothetical protein J5756_03585 [Clostridia bacterium]|nr:hypothetical protein [Clostridia bacterium]